jgi:inhibitor of KinA sporulation pathway (predicted exonuclease)
MSMHPEILRRIGTKQPGYAYLQTCSVADRFRDFLNVHGYDHTKNGPKLNVAGKNYASFDARFLRRLPRWDDVIPTAHRTIDPAILFYRESDEKLPGTELCCERAGIKPYGTAHTAIDDAKTVIQLVRAALPQKGIQCL